MKTLNRFLAVTFVALLSSASSAFGQAYLSFSGGNGAPLTLTLAQPVTYVITLVPSGSAPYFVFEAVGNAFNSFPAVAGSISFTVNGGSPQALTDLRSGLNVGALTPDDAFLFGSFPPVAVGNVITLGAGTLTTVGNFAGAPPAAGAFDTFIMDVGIRQISGPGFSVPEPSEWALLGCGFGILALARRICRTRHLV